jgi:hypothetical protein
VPEEAKPCVFSTSKRVLLRIALLMEFVILGAAKNLSNRRTGILACQLPDRNVWPTLRVTSPFCLYERIVYSINNTGFNK